MIRRLMSLGKKRSLKKSNFVRHRKLIFEGLEGRALMATFNWNLAGDGDFGVAGNWLNTTTNLPGVPGAGDTANIGGNIEVTSTASRTVNNVIGFGSIRVSGGTFSVANSIGDTTIIGLTVDSGATFRTVGGSSNIIGSEISGTLNTLNGATFRFLRGANSLNAGSSMIGVGQYLMLGDAFGAATLNLKTNTIAPTNFELQNGVITGTANLTIGGVFDWNANPSGASMMGTGQTIVQPTGTLNIEGTAGTIDTRTINNSGRIFFGASSDLVLQNGATINNLASATFEIQTDNEVHGGVGGNLVNAGTIEKTAGMGTTQLRVNLTNTGTVDVQTGTLAFFVGQGTNGTYKTSVGAFLDLTGGNSYLLAGTNTFQGNGTVFTGSGQLSIDSLGATWAIPGTVSMLWTSNTLVIPIGATLTVNGNMTFPSSTDTSLRGGGRVTMNGNLIHNGSGNIVIQGDLATNSVATTVEIPAARNYQINSDGGILSFGAGGILINAGTINKILGMGTSPIQANIDNTGTIKTTRGTLALHKTTTVGGTLTASINSTLKLTDNASAQFLVSGVTTANGSGTISFGFGNLIVGASGATINISSTTNFVWSGGNMFVPAAATLSLNGNLSITSSSTVILLGGGTAVFNGTTTQSSVGHLRIDGDGGTGPTTLKIPTGKSYVLADDGGLVAGISGSGVVDNAGLVRKSGGAGLSILSLPLAKPANLQVDLGTLQLSAANSIVSGGNFSVAAGAVVDLVGASNIAITFGGSFTGSGAGKVQLNRGTFVVSNAGGGATFNFPSGLFEWLGGSIDTNGSTMTIQGAASFAGAGNVSVGGLGRLQINGIFEHTSTGTLNVLSTATLAVGSTGAYNFRKNSSIAGSGSIENSGVIRKNGGTAVSTIGISVSNTGTIESRLGTLLITGTISEIVSNTLTGGVWAAFGTVSNTARLDLNTAINAIGLAATVKLSGPNSSIGSISGLTSNAGNFQLLGGANFATSGNFSNSGNILVSATSVFDVSGVFTHSSGVLTLQMNNASIGRVRTLGTATLAGALAITFTGTPPAVGSSVTILENQSALAINGTFAGLPQSAVVSFGGMTWRIRYNQGTGNDVTLLRLT